MTNFEYLKTLDLDKSAEFLEDNSVWDTSGPAEWFQNSFCEKCQPVKVRYKDYNRFAECKWCELNEKCKHFKHLDSIPDFLYIIKLWLNSESKSGEN